MLTARRSAAIALAGMSALWAGHSVGAITPITNVNITGTYDVWEDNGSGQLVNSGAGTAFETYLMGTAAAPGDNIELGNDRTYADWASGDITTLTGDLGSDLSVVFTTPTQSDWTADGLALAYNYVNAALASVGKTSSDWTGPVSFDDAVTEFVFGSTTPGTSGAFRLSDPNLGYVYSKPTSRGPAVVIGLQGLFNASDILEPLLDFVQYNPASDPFPPQASEVVRLDIYDSGSLIESSFRYSFSANRTNQGAIDCYTDTNAPVSDDCSYSGNYEVPLPAPALLLTLGFSSLFGVRRAWSRASRSVSG